MRMRVFTRELYAIVGHGSKHRLHDWEPECIDRHTSVQYKGWHDGLLCRFPYTHRDETMDRPEKKLTDRQAAVLDFIGDHIVDTGFPPTIREIGDHLGISSTNGVNDHLKALERKGYLTREDAKSRAIRPLFGPSGEPFDPSMTSEETAILDDVHEIPILGRIAAGAPITAVENIEDRVRVGESLIGRPTDVFGLVVKGESMIEDGIFDGDYIFVKKQADARNNEIVAVMVDGEATVKRFFREKTGVIRLQPSNSAMEPIFVTAAEARDTQVLGKVIGVFRRL